MCEASIKQMWSASQNLHMKLSNRELFILDPWLRKFPWRRERLPSPVFWPGESHRMYSPWGCKESDMTERLSFILKKKNKPTLKFKTVTLLPFSPLLGSINCFSCTSPPYFQRLKPLYFLRLYQVRGWNWSKWLKHSLAGSCFLRNIHVQPHNCPPETSPSYF